MEETGSDSGGSEVLPATERGRFHALTLGVRRARGAGGTGI